jgi:hypothetical protein
MGGVDKMPFVVARRKVLKTVNCVGRDEEEEERREEKRRWKKKQWEWLVQGRRRKEGTLSGHWVGVKEEEEEGEWRGIKACW